MGSARFHPEAGQEHLAEEVRHRIGEHPYAEQPAGGGQRAADRRGPEEQHRGDTGERQPERDAPVLVLALEVVVLLPVEVFRGGDEQGASAGASPACAASRVPRELLTGSGSQARRSRRARLRNVISSGPSRRRSWVSA
ncbi:hypothetical protein AMK15_23255 [Streptomyces sp. MJM1172]|nr:hypothetical protein AMK15_23255 [Streptomyces sp. MJM1172]